MDKNAIKKYAVWARTELIDRVSQKALQYGITEKDSVPASATSVNGVVLSKEEMAQRKALLERIAKKGYKQVMEEVAYTWFNRFSALRFMEVNGYLPSRVRVFTDENNQFEPQIIAEAIDLEMDGLDMEKVYAYKDANDKEGLFKYLVIVQCNALSPIMPGMFQRIADYTELLFPDNLLREGSAVQRMIEWIPEEDWKDQVQIIGWLYQYYNTEPKATVDEKVKKGIKVSKSELPAKTQIFTPDWVVRYMVENSLGRLWVEGHPDENLKAGWTYYLDEAEQETEVTVQLEKIRKEYAGITPEQIKCIDPCSGSGHICAYMFDVLMQIYETYGYTAREAVRSIVENNIYGLDIDERAAQLAYFSVMMKARQYDRRFLTRKDENGNVDVPQPHIYEIFESDSLDSYALDYFINGDAKCRDAICSIIKDMRNAKEFGSLIKVTPVNFDLLYDRFAEIQNDINIARELALSQLLPLVSIAEILSKQYEVVITNPPYLGGGGMSEVLAEYAREHYPLSKNDLFAAFLERGGTLAKHGYFNCMVTMQSWMFLSSYEKMRANILKTKTISNVVHMDNQVMGIAFGTAATVLRNHYLDGYKGTYNYIYYNDVVNDAPRSFPIDGNRFAQVASRFYQDIPGCPIAYWISKTTRDSFLSKDTIGSVAPPKQGLATADNNTFLRLWHEVDIHSVGFGMSSCDDAYASKLKWFPYNKGGSFRRWYGNRDYVVNWENDGFEIKNFRDEKGKVRSRPQNLQYYFKPAITWSDVTSGSFSGRYVEKGFMFDIKGSSGFPSTDILPYVLGLLNSKVAQAFIKILNPTMTTQVGDMTRIPVIISEQYKDEIISLVEDNIAQSKLDWDSRETSWDFERHPLVGKYTLLSEAVLNRSAIDAQRFETVKKNEERINELFIRIYGLETEMTADVNPNHVTIERPTPLQYIKGLISYAVGCMFGRYSLDDTGLIFAGGEWDDSKYSIFKADKDTIIPICDDEYFADDIVNRFVQFVDVVYGKNTLAENLHFIADTLGGNGQPKDVIRKYFMDEFYADHCSTYSVTGSGKRPIYWMFDSGKKGGFRALVYMHRYQPDTIARMRTDYVHEQQARYRTAIADLEQRIASASTSERVKLSKRLKTLQEQAAEIQGYEEKIHHLADQYISIDLDDGVKVNYAKFQDVLAKIK